METTGKEYSRKAAGFTLLEVMISLVILAIGLLGTVLLETTTVTGNSFSRELQTATILAEDLVEQVQSLDYGDPLIAVTPPTHPTAADITGGWVANPLNEAGVNVAGALYTRTWQVADPSPIVNSKTVTVTVSWQKKGTPHSVTISTVKHQNAP